MTFRTRLVRALADRGLEVTAAGGYDEAVASARRDTPELALVGTCRLPTCSGLDVVRALKELDPTTIIVVLTGYGSIATAVESLKLGAATYLTKPVDADQILAAFNGERVLPAGDEASRGAVAGAGGMGTYPAGARRLWRQPLARGAAGGHSPSLAPA